MRALPLGRTRGQRTPTRTWSCSSIPTRSSSRDGERRSGARGGDPPRPGWVLCCSRTASNQHQRRGAPLHRLRVGRAGRRAGVSGTCHDARSRVLVGSLPGYSSRPVAEARWLSGALLHVLRGRRPLAQAPSARRQAACATRCARRTRLRVRQGRAEMAVAGAESLGHGAPHVSRAAARAGDACAAGDRARRVGVALRGRWGCAKARATIDVVRALPSLLRERRTIQAAVRVPASAFASSLTATLDSPYFGRAGRHPAVRLACRLYWRCVVSVLARLDAPGPSRSSSSVEGVSATGGDERRRAGADRPQKRESQQPECPRTDPAEAEQRRAGKGRRQSGEQRVSGGLVTGRGRTPRRSACRPRSCESPGESEATRAARTVLGHESVTHTRTVSRAGMDGRDGDVWAPGGTGGTVVCPTARDAVCDGVAHGHREPGRCRRRFPRCQRLRRPTGGGSVPRTPPGPA